MHFPPTRSARALYRSPGFLPFGVLTAVVLVFATPAGGFAAPVIDVWYGPVQSFGQIGQPQPYVNIVGNVQNATGLSYTLNGGSAVTLSIGPDGRRLLNPGDFNADIHISQLNAGANEVIITATGGGTTSDTVTVNYTPGTTWPGTYSIDWSTLSSPDEINDVAQVVDGKWILENGYVKTADYEWGYDRLIAIGDAEWQDYEVLVPFIIHQGYANTGVGVLFRWNGHTNDPVVCSQPMCGWWPLGAITWYELGCWDIEVTGGGSLDNFCVNLTLNQKYWIRARVETTEFGSFYRLRYWADGDAEPGTWTVIGLEPPTSPKKGSMLLVVHASQASFGNVTVTELTPPEIPPVARGDRRYVPPSGLVDVNVLRNDSDTDGQIDSTSVVIVTPPAHGIATPDPLTGLVAYQHDGGPDTTDSFTYTVNDDDGYTSNEATVDITVTNDPQPAVFSDDFNRCELDQSLWTFYNWLADGWYTMSGAGSGEAVIQLSVPGGKVHDAWGGNGLNESAHIKQLADDVDFEIEAKFNTEPTGDWNNQGLIVEQDNQNWARFDVFHTGFQVSAFMGYTLGGVNTPYLEKSAPPGSTYYLRVTRTGDDYTMYHSGDGSNWTTVGTVNLPFSVTAVGVYGANPVTGVAYTAEVDYFQHTQIPLVNEDAAENIIATSTSGNGSISVSPPGPAYSCGDKVELTALPDFGWTFAGWSGDLTGTDNPDSLTVDGPMAVTATFSLVSAIGDTPAAGRFELLEARPNPFNPTTRIAFRLPVRADVRLDIFDVHGARVRRLVRQSFPAGEHYATWDGRNDAGEQVSTGVYFYRLEADRFSAARKLVLIK